MRYILLVADYFSRFALGFAVKELSVYTVMKIWSFVAEVFGYPREAYMDNAKYFSTEEILNFFRQKGTILLGHPTSCDDEGRR